MYVAAIVSCVTAEERLLFSLALVTRHQTFGDLRDAVSCVFAGALRLRERLVETESLKKKGKREKRKKKPSTGLVLTPSLSSPYSGALSALYGPGP